MARWRDYIEPGDEVSIADTPEPEPDIPHAIGILFGVQPGWSPGQESQRLGDCKVCKNAIRDGSRVYCAGCGRYGLDGLIPGVLAESHVPEPDVRPAVPPPVRGRITLPRRFRTPSSEATES